MENFFLHGTFYESIEDVINEYEWNSYSNIPDDFSEICYESVEQPIGKFYLEDLTEYVEEYCMENIPEDNNDWYYEQINEAVEQSIDFKKLNSLLPTSYVEGTVKFKLVKEDFKPCFLNIDLSSFDNNEL